MRTCRWCGGKGCVHCDRHGMWYVFCARCHRETERFDEKPDAVSAWNATRLHVPEHRTQEHVIEKNVSPEPFQIEVISDRGKDLIRMFAWCMVDMDANDARRLIRLLEDAIKQVDMETSETEQAPA